MKGGWTNTLVVRILLTLCWSIPTIMIAIVGQMMTRVLACQRSDNRLSQEEEGLNAWMKCW